uniref:NBS-LRR resistance-like protein B8 n=1 Tax=Phaseolus vulgaris TaxID=3885 RepID=Q93VS9_PHAVU|nr:NBS-LRR resistance-like protein B8 [Phaseolus vulgaris]AAK61319.1 NBS-LRR resistance-like protein B8 [Phaseolus vulgaris]
MAAELVGGALLSAFLQVAFDRLASPQVLDFFRGRKLDEKLLRNLKIMLHSINALADDAELKQFTDPHVKEWLFEVKEAVFDAEDLLGEIDYELTRGQVEAPYEPQTFTSQVSNFVDSTFTSFNKKIESEMKEVLEKLEYLAKQKDALGLKRGTYSDDNDRSGSRMSQKLPSSSLVVESVIYGRDADKDIIINWLTSETDNPNQPSILSIVGMGGLGKTTLAQHVYSDPKIEDAKFDIKAWVCVSDHFHVLTVTRTILEAITDKTNDSGNLEMVHKKLKEKLLGKRFLLVLDDVWNERPAEWEAVRTPLSYGAPGSRILVTTRSEKVASSMRSEVHLLKQLGEDECWKVFENHALKDGDLELNDELMKVGRRIVEKCKGLPLALKTIGCLLSTKSSISDWKNILESDIWKLPKEHSEIIPALFLSYRHLPSHLKRCFAYCALFPKDYEFVKEELIFLWMAQNFLLSPQHIRDPEEIGEEYFNDLLSRCFFNQSSIVGHFVMHDLLNDLAKYVCADFCFRLKFDNEKCMPKTTCHFSFEFLDVESFDGFESLTNAKRLRSFLPISETWGASWHFKISIHDLFSKIKFIRVLSFHGCLDLREVPDSVGDLKHLQSLDLSSTEIQKLPDSICLLYNLLILKLSSCSKLKEFPLNLHKLTKLRCLEFEGTDVRKMPMHFGELKNLQVLSMFLVDKNSELSTKQLGGLGGLNLHGRLSINDVQNIGNPLDALKANLKDKRLVKLELKWKWNHVPDDPKKEKEVLQNLQPSNHLEKLLIRNYSGTEFPSWVFDNSLSNLVFLNLEDCKYCLCLPSLGLLSSLKILHISGLDGIVSIGAEFYGSNSSFASLERLEFHNMKEWEEWECKTTSFPRLEVLYVDKCPKLKGTKVVVSDELRISGNSMDTSHTDGIFRLHFFPKLRSLQLEDCQNLRRISQEYAHNHLMNLYIHDCPQFKSFLFPKPSLTKLKSFLFSELKSFLFPKPMQILFPSLTELHIVKCPEVELFPDGGLPLNIKHISLSSLKLIVSLRDNLDPNTSLQSLNIHYLEVECFPDEVLLPRSLTSLGIRWCPNLKKMHYKGLCHLSSLTLLECPSLQCLPTEGLPKSISSLTICGCPLLKERCRNPDGEDWRKIAHIQQLYV